MILNLKSQFILNTPRNIFSNLHQILKIYKKYNEEDTDIRYSLYNVDKSFVKGKKSS